MSTPKIRRFWDWFAARAETISKDPRKHADEIGEMIDRIDPDLSWEMGGSNPSEFIVRSEDSELRFLAHKVIAAAPTLPGWAFSPWRGQRTESGEGFVLTLEGNRKFPVSTATFEIEDHPSYPLVNLTMVAPSFSKGKDEDRLEPGFLTIDCLLGEKLAEDSLNHIEFRGGKQGAIPAAKLNHEVKRRIAKMTSRNYPKGTTWNLLEAETKTGPLLAKVAAFPPLDLISTHVWLVEHVIELKNPNENGFPSTDELRSMDSFEDAAFESVEKSGGLHFGTVTHDGKRTFKYYYPHVDDLSERLNDLAGKHSLKGRVSVTYDSRWRDFRHFSPKE